jgi:hypothetical protein
MTPAEVAATLRQFSTAGAVAPWRTGRSVEQPDPREVGEAIDAAIEMIERMEKHLRLILEEPENTMSNGKAMREMLRQARLALEESK